MKMVLTRMQQLVSVVQLDIYPVKAVQNASLVVLVPMVLGVKIVMLVDIVRVNLGTVKIQIQPIV
jgi:hypothetical protein